MPKNSVDVFIIDIPWNQQKGGLRKARPNQKRTLDYNTMTTRNVFDLLDKEIFSLANNQHTVFMWTIEKFLLECEQYMTERGYKRHVRLIWNKTNGIAPAFSIRYSHEYLIWYYKPKFTPVSKETRGKFCSIFTEPAREHSRKPDLSYNMIQRWFPDATIMDVFSREPRPGILQWGNQTEHFTPKAVNTIPIQQTL